MSLAAFIAARRAELGLSLQKVASAAGSTKAHVWELEQGRTSNPCVSTLVRLSSALGVPAVLLFEAALSDGEGRVPSSTTDPDRAPGMNPK